MAQIFHRSSNTLAQISLLSAIVLPALLILGGSAISRSPWNTKVGIPKDQPVPFSHEHHTVELGIDCRYCHNAVEKSSWANVPSSATCYTCHSQIWTNSPLLEPVRNSVASGDPIRWNQLHRVPDFVYFNHSIHINRGLNCNVCHGPIQKEMIAYRGKSFYMAWCVKCHRNPEEYVGEREDVWKLYDKFQRYQTGDNKLTPEQLALAEGDDYTRTDAEVKKGEERLTRYKVQKKQLADCSICHR